MHQQIEREIALADDENKRKMSQKQQNIEEYVLSCCEVRQVEACIDAKPSHIPYRCYVVHWRRQTRLWIRYSGLSGRLGGGNFSKNTDFSSCRHENTTHCGQNLGNT